MMSDEEDNFANNNEHSGNENELPDVDNDGDIFGANQENEGDGDAENNADDKGVKVEPKRRVVRNPRPKLTVETLSGPRGIQTIENYFKDIKFKGKGYEKQDLNEVLSRLQHWGHRMYPTYTFDDVLNNIERLSKKKPLHVHMSRYRLGMIQEIDKYVNDVEEAEGEGAGALPEDEPYDEFDALLGEQIAISRLAPRTPAHNRSRDSFDATTPISSIATPSFNRGNNNVTVSTPYSNIVPLDETDDLAKPLPPSQPEVPAPPTVRPTQLTKEQLDRIEENKRLAMERLKAKKLAEEQKRAEALQTVEAS